MTKTRGSVLMELINYSEIPDFIERLVDSLDDFLAVNDKGVKDIA